MNSAGELDTAVAALGGYEHGLYAERWCPYQKVRIPSVSRAGVRAQAAAPTDIHRCGLTPAVCFSRSRAGSQTPYMQHKLRRQSALVIIGNGPLHATA